MYKKFIWNLSDYFKYLIILYPVLSQQSESCQKSSIFHIPTHESNQPNSILNDLHAHIL